MRILFVAPRFHTNQHFLVQTLQARGHEVRFIVGNIYPHAEHYETLRPQIAKTKRLPTLLCSLIDAFMRLKGDKPRTHFHYRPDSDWIIEQLIDFQPDIVIARDAAYPLSIATHRAAKRRGISTILYTQAPLEDIDNLLLRTLKTINWAPQTRFTPVRRDRRNTYNRHTNSYYVPLPVNFSYDITQKTYCHGGIIRLLFIGKFTLSRKQHLLLLRAFTKLQKNLSLQLTIVGAANDSQPELLQQIQSYVNEMELTKLVTIYTNLPYNKMSELYRGHDLFILPSTEEPFSIAPLEAMNHGLGVIVSDTNGAQHCVEEGVTGHIVRSHDEAHLQEVLQTICQDCSYIETIGQQAFAYIREQHSASVVYDSFMEVISKVSE